VRRTVLMLFFLKTASVGVAFLASVVIGKFYSREIAGFYFYLISIVGLVATPMSLGIASVAAGVLNERERRLGKLNARGFVVESSNTIILVALVAVIVGVAISFLGINTPKILGRPFLFWPIAIATAAGLAYTTIMTEIYRYFQAFKEVALTSGFFANFIFLIAALALAVRPKNAGAADLLTAYAVSFLSIASLAWWRLRKIDCSFQWSVLDGTFLVGTSLPVVLTNLGAFVITQAHTFVASLVLPAAENASYGASARLVLIIALAPSILHSVALPVAAKIYYRGEYEKLERFMRSSATMATAMVAPLLIIIIAAPGYILDHLYRPGYADASLSLRILAIASLYNIARGFPGMAMMQFSMQKIQARITILGGFVSLVAIGFAGATGAPHWIAIAVLFSTLFQGAMEHILIRRRVGISPAWDFRLLFNPKELIRRQYVE